jgi:threonine aldolase
MAAIIFGKDESMIVPSGTMGNLIALITHCQRGDNVIVDSNAHIFLDEMNGINSVAQLIPRPIPTSSFDADQIKKNIRMPANASKTGLVCIENTHNRASGMVVPLEVVTMIADSAHYHDVPVHIDGARIFNAAVALGLDVAQLVESVDTVMFCLSKGLCCPIGSMLVGSSRFIEKARNIRRLLGGGMRQAGIIASAGIVALSTTIDHLKADHRHAKRLADGLTEIPSIMLAEENVQTNIVRFELGAHRVDGNSLTELLRRRGILVDYKGDRQFRMVTHRGINGEAVEIALSALKETLEIA